MESKTCNWTSLFKELPGKTLKMLPDFFLLLIGKWKRRDKLRKELVNKKKPELDDFENVQPLQVAKDAKSQKWLQKLWHREKG